MGEPLSTRQFLTLTGLGLLAFFGIWTLAAAFELAPRRFLPLPWEVFSTAWSLTTDPFSGQTIQGHALSSIQRFASGFALAALIGLPLGILMGWYRWLDHIISPLFDALRFVAPIAWVPFAALWFGTGIGGPMLIIIVGALPPCLINAYRGARQVEQKYIEAARMLGASGPRTMLEVLLPAATPSVVAGLRVGAGAGLQSLIAAELVSANSGIGLMMIRGQGILDTSIVMVGMIVVGLLGVIMDVSLRLAERRIRRRRGLES